MEFYYLIWVRSNRYHGQEGLTYLSKEPLVPGTIVEVELQHQMVLGIVFGRTHKPRFVTKEIVRIIPVRELPAQLLRLARWLQNYYPATVGLVTQQFVPSSLSSKRIESLESAPPSPIPAALTAALNPDQQKAVDAINKNNTYLLHGITGSGKTRLYLEITRRTLLHNRSAIVLTPEISLTSQLSGQFIEAFGNRVIVIHSQQTAVEREKAWLRINLSPYPIVVIGPRSALYSPLQSLGLIILDEAHETAYKQEQSPQYQTGRVASYLARLTDATLILGSATPSVVDYYLAQQKGKPILSLPSLARQGKHAPSEVSVVDIKQRDEFRRSPHLSTLLIDKISSALNRQEQVLLYLNRRGTARLVMCEVCSWQALCPHCDIALVYHEDTNDLRCHSCNYHNPVPSSCPECHHTSILFEVAGTKAIFAEVKRLFPHARIGRFDTDNRKSERLENNYLSIREGNIDILIGTQLLAKGLDLPRLSTLGVIIADTNLYFPDYSASERTYQLLSQVLGRIGRGHLPGFAVIQTYHPDHPVIQAALAQDFTAFYTSELAARKAYLFPPFCYLLKLTCRRASSRAAEIAAEKLKNDLIAHFSKIVVEGPCPAFQEKIGGKYVWQIVVKSTQRSILLEIISQLPSNWSADIDPINLL